MLRIEKLLFWLTLTTFAFPLAANLESGYRLHLFELPMWALYLLWAFRFGLRLARLRLIKFDYVFMLFMLWLALSMSVNDAWGFGANNMGFWIKSFLIGIYLRHNLYRLYSLPALVWFFAIVLFFEVSLGILQGITQSSIGVVQQYFGQIMDHTSVYNTGVIHVVRVQGTFKHCNILGNWIVMLLPLIITKALVSVGSQRRFCWLCAAAAIVALILTLSRGNWGALVFGLFVMANVTGILKAKRFNMSKAVAGALVGGTYMVLMSAIFFEELSVFTDALTQRVEKLPGSRSGTTRYNLALGAIQLIDENLLWGVGLGKSNELLHYTDYEIRERFSSTVHNIFLIIATEGGLVALVLFLIFLWQPIKNLYRVAKKRPGVAQEEDSFAAAGLLGGYSSLVFAMLWYVGMLDQSELPLIMTFLHLSLGVAIQKKPLLPQVPAADKTLAINLSQRQISQYAPVTLRT